MKKVFRLIAAAMCISLLLCGCGREEKVPCFHCGEPVARGISLDNGDVICGTCFSENEYLICLKCNEPYDPQGSGDTQLGYCAGCEVKYAGACDLCGDMYPSGQLEFQDDGRPVCVMCLYGELNEIVQDPSILKYYNVEYWDAYDEGFDDGYEYGYETGTGDGYEDGSAKGYEEGHRTGLAEGKEQGYKSGYDEGYAKGTADSAPKSSGSTQTSGKTTASSTAGSSGGSGTTQTQSVTVYITKTGSKYHRSGCQYLSKSKIAISLSDAKSRGYTACSRCW